MNNLKDEYIKEMSKYKTGYTDEDLNVHYKSEIVPILKIAKVMCDELNNHNGTYFAIESFTNEYGFFVEYGVIHWNGSDINILPFNITANSKYATVNCLAKYMNGGHYDEVESFEKMKSNPEVHHCFSFKTTDIE